MKELVLSRRQTREVDRRAIEEYGLPGIVLMENAGRGVVEAILAQALPAPYLICCGKGNNGGDGFVIARHLDNLGHRVRVMTWGEEHEFQRDAAINLQVLKQSGIELRLLGQESCVEELQQYAGDCGTVIDALLGTGAMGEPRPPLHEVIATINAAGKPVLAVDLPSGLDCDTGRASQQTIRASHTCTFVAWKPGFLVPDARPFTGQVQVVSIGAPRQLIEAISRET